MNLKPKKMKNTCSLLAGLFISLGTLSCGNPGNTETDAEDAKVTIDSTADTKTVAENDQTDASDLILYTFMNNEMQAGLARAAEAKAASQSVRDLSEQLVIGNKEIAAKLKDLAKASEVELPGGLEVEQQTKMDSVQQLAPEDFDQAYVNMLVKQQKDNIEMLENLSAKADNAIVRGLASDIIDIQQTQIEDAEAVQGEIGS